MAAKIGGKNMGKKKDETSSEILRKGHGDTPTISKGKRGYKVTPLIPKKEQKIKKMLKIPDSLKKTKDPFKDL